MLTSKKKIEPASKLIKKLKIEPPYSAGDCGYKAIIIGLLYLSLKAKDIPHDSLENKAISNALKLKPNGLYNWLLRSDLIKENGSNAEILRALVSGLNKKFMFNLTELYEELIPKLKLASSDSKWLYNLIKETLTSGFWDAYEDILKVPSIKVLESKVEASLAKSQIFTLDDLDILKIEARNQVITSLSEEQLKKIINDIKDEVFLKKNTWLDMFYLKKLTEQLLGSENIFFDDKGIKINDEGPLPYHWYIDLPDDQYSLLLMEACHNQMLIINRLSIPNSSKESEEKSSGLLADKVYFQTGSDFSYK